MLAPKAGARSVRALAAGATGMALPRDEHGEAVHCDELLHLGLRHRRLPIRLVAQHGLRLQLPRGVRANAPARVVLGGF